MFQISEKILLTIWVGGMWAIGYIVAPVLFQMLDKPVAGNVAGQLFTIINYIGIFCAIGLISSILIKNNFIDNPFDLEKINWQAWVLLVMLVVIMVGQFILQPMMADLKEAGISAENAKQFGRLHGVASALFLMNSIAGLALVVFGLERKN